MERVAALALQRDADVLAHGQMREHRRNLERAHEAHPRDGGRPRAGDVVAVVEDAARAWASRKCVSRLKQVVLPAPFGPISAWMVPRRTSRSTSLTATKPLNSLVSPWVERIVSSAIGRCPGRPRGAPHPVRWWAAIIPNGPAKSNARASTGQRRVPSQRCAFCVASNCAGLSMPMESAAARAISRSCAVA